MAELIRLILSASPTRYIRTLPGTVRATVALIVITVEGLLRAIRAGTEEFKTWWRLRRLRSLFGPRR